MTEFRSSFNYYKSLHKPFEDEDKYRKKYYALLKRTNNLLKENEMLVHRIYGVKKLVYRLRRERRFLVEHLEAKGDNFYNIALPFALEEEKDNVETVNSLPSSSSGTNQTKKQSNKKEKPERDKNAPRAPSNAFLQFCQEQREIIQSQHLQETGQVGDRKTLTKILAAKWNKLTQEEKKVYVERFEKDRERYLEEMKVYENTKQEIS